jgi:hypothetical protein
MKKTFTGLIAVPLLFCLNGVQAQTTTTSLDQLKLNQSFVGTWQQDIGKDTISFWEVQQFEKATVSTATLKIKDKKSFIFADNWVYSSNQDEFKGVKIYPGGGYGTWIAKFTSEKKFSGDWVRNFNPGEVTGKFEVIFETPSEMTIIQYDATGVKKWEFKAIKVK